MCVCVLCACLSVLSRYAAKAFDVLERLDPDPEYWEGKRGAIVGVFQLVVAGKTHSDELRDALAMVRVGRWTLVCYAADSARDWHRTFVRERACGLSTACVLLPTALLLL